MMSVGMDVASFTQIDSCGWMVPGHMAGYQLDIAACVICFLCCLLFDCYYFDSFGL